MRVERKDSSQEKYVLTGLIVSTPVLSKVAGCWDKEGLFGHDWSNLIAKWCVDYHASYGKAPGKNVVALFEAWADENPDKETVALVDRYLTTLDGEYKQRASEVNPDHVIDTAGKYFNRVRAQKVKDTVEGHLDNGEVDKAWAVLERPKRVELGTGSHIDVLSDEDAMRRAFEQKSEPLITYPGDLGRFFEDAFERDGFIGLMGPEKRGKTAGLLDIAWMAMKERRKVAFFEVGDMSEAQILRRFGTRAARKPRKPCTVKVPTLFKRGGETTYEIEHEEREFKKSLTWGEAWAACQKTLKRARTKDSLLRLGVYPNSSVSVNGVREQIDVWSREGWTPDVVVVDYADILAPVNGTADTRDQINLTWKLLRRMSQELHCLVVTATQTDADSYDAHFIRKANFSEDKRKLAHVTGMLGLNQTDDEKRDGVYRLNWVVLRESDYGESNCVHVAGCLALASPFMKSFL